MTPQEIIKEIGKLPLASPREVLETLNGNIQQTEEQLEQEVLNRLLAKGIISKIPPHWNDENYDEDFEPIEIEGEPLSETIIRERR